MPDSVQDLLRQNLVRYLVSQTIFCPRSGEVLDVRTCVVILDYRDDPAMVLSQKGWEAVSADKVAMTVLTTRGYRVDETTVAP